jgi:Homing endonuclease associated repeat
MGTKACRLMSPNFVTSENLLADLASVAAKVNRRRISQTDYSDHGLYSPLTICRRFNSWREALAIIGCEPLHWRNVSAQTLLDDIQRVAGDSPPVNRQPISRHR